jgi:hypothetical protein
MIRRLFAMIHPKTSGLITSQVQIERSDVCGLAITGLSTHSDVIWNIFCVLGWIQFRRYYIALSAK